MGFVKNLFWVSAIIATGGLAAAVLPSDMNGIDGYESACDEQIISSDPTYLELENSQFNQEIDIPSRRLGSEVGGLNQNIYTKESDKYGPI